MLVNIYQELFQENLVLADVANLNSLSKTKVSKSLVWVISIINKFQLSKVTKRKKKREIIQILSEIIPVFALLSHFPVCWRPAPIRLLSLFPPIASLVISCMHHTCLWLTRKLWLYQCTTVGQDELTLVHMKRPIVLIQVTLSFCD